MIVRGGENVLPAEVEEVIYAYPKVADVAVIRKGFHMSYGDRQ